MSAITFEEAKQFLENINHKDNIAIIHDTDTDGFSSGIIYDAWCKRKKAKTNSFSYIRLKSSVKDWDLRPFNKIIITDVPFNVIKDELKLMEGKEVLMCDHHMQDDTLLPANIHCYNPFREGYFPSARIAYTLTNLKPLMALCGMIGDAADLYAENKELLSDLFEKCETNVDDTRNNISGLINCYIIYAQKHNTLRQAFEKLCTIENKHQLGEIKKQASPVLDEIEYHLKEFFNKKEDLGKMDFYEFEPEYDIKGTVITILTIKLHNRPCIFAIPLDKDHLSLSARDQGRKLNVADVLKEGMKGFSDCTSGGHAYAAGGKILKKDLPKFKENVKKYLLTIKS